jgi:hypothetical protein
MADPKDDPAESDEFEILNDPINVAREAEEIAEEWGDEAADIAKQNAAYYRMCGNDDRVAEWLEVMRLIEERYTVRKDDVTVKAV